MGRFHIYLDVVTWILLGTSDLAVGSSPNNGDIDDVTDPDDVTAVQSTGDVTGVISNSTLRQIKHRLNLRNNTFVRKAGESVRLMCGQPLTVKVQDDTPDTELIWKFNSQSLGMDPSRMFFYKDNLDITVLTPADSGVYACALAWGVTGRRYDVTVAVFSLQVTTPSTTRCVYHGSRLPLPCHATQLEAIFPNTQRHWSLNGTVVTSLGPTPSDARDIDVVESAEYKMAGVWECHVVDNTSGRVWGTSWYRVGVMTPPSLPERAYRVMSDNLGVTVGVASLVGGVCLACFLVACVKLTKDEDRNEKRRQLEGKGWESVFEEHRGKKKIQWEDVEREQGGEEESESTDESTDEVTPFMK